MGRESHRAAVEAGYASLRGYIEKWGDEMDRDLKREIAIRSYANQEIHDRIDKIENDLTIMKFWTVMSATLGLFFVFMAIIILWSK